LTCGTVLVRVRSYSQLFDADQSRSLVDRQPAMAWWLMVARGRRFRFAPLA
jgi:hypothetical protein